MKAKKGLAILLVLMMAVGMLVSCQPKTNPGASKPNTSEAAGTSSSEPVASKSTHNGKDIKDIKIALVCDTAGTQVFVNMMIDGLKASAEKHGFKHVVVECPDAASYEENIRSLVQEGTDLIIVGGWQGGEALNTIAKEYPDKAQYALIDSEVEAENVKCISYREQEGAYLIGMIAAQVVPEGTKIFGSVHCNEGPGSWKWRYGYMEGVKQFIPDAQFVFNYVGSYNDPAKAKELAGIQAEQGCKFINSCAAGGDIGVFEAAKQYGFFTSGQDVDLTDPENPNIVSSQIKDTKATIEYLIDQYMSDYWSLENETWGISEGSGTIGAVYVTHDSKNPRSPELTDEELQKVKDKAEAMRSGTFDMSKMPAEDEYFGKK